MKCVPGKQLGLLLKAVFIGRSDLRASAPTSLRAVTEERRFKASWRHGQTLLVRRLFSPHHRQTVTSTVLELPCCLCGSRARLFQNLRTVMDGFERATACPSVPATVSGETVQGNSAALGSCPPFRHLPSRPDESPREPVAFREERGVTERPAFYGRPAPSGPEPSRGATANHGAPSAQPRLAPQDSCRLLIPSSACVACLRSACPLSFFFPSSGLFFRSGEGMFAHLSLMEALFE
ncbi:hypothetical protein SKAU_G00190670 [Synaphobranchus kaupii]|uniref:Uncharacterized protein n=1 Tax=Synaphobranchus kaupii TaxID=118154 RepID=A0A9Q1IX91_SYNKA|nr:hypothetical protein SKAU_G00190670 [Synaphobranchus kaupii]